MTAADDMEHTGWANMCPVGTVAGEIADAEPELRVVAAEVVTTWVDEGTRYLAARGLAEPGCPRARLRGARSARGRLHPGAAQRSTEPLLAAGRALAAYAASLPLTVLRQ